MLTLQQLRTACTVAEAGFNLSRTAELLHTTQPAVSKTIKSIELDLGAPVFLRCSMRITGFTPLGENLVELARNILRDSAAMIDLANESTGTTRGVLAIGTTHCCARYMLPQIARAFSGRYPDVALCIEQGDPNTIPDWVATGKVVLGITPVSRPVSNAVVALKARDSEHCVIAPRGHAILAIDPLTLADLAMHPLITYSSNLAATSDLQSILRDHGYTPQVAVIARDSSVVKAHVSCGIGIGVIQSIAIEPRDEQMFGIADASHLLPAAAFHVLFRREQYFRSYIYDFIEMFSPQWTRETIGQRLSIGHDKDRIEARTCAVGSTRT